MTYFVVEKVCLISVIYVSKFSFPFVEYLGTFLHWFDIAFQQSGFWRESTNWLQQVLIQSRKFPFKYVLISKYIVDTDVTIIFPGHKNFLNQKHEFQFLTSHLRNEV